MCLLYHTRLLIIWECGCEHMQISTLLRAIERVLKGETYQNWSRDHYMQDPAYMIKTNTEHLHKLKILKVK